MGLHDTVSAERTHIGFFGVRNAGKSSLVNAVTGQALSVVSDVKGTTTDPVRKAMELLPIGPVLIIDTPGFDDEGALGGMRVQKTREILSKTDLAVLVVDAQSGLCAADRELIELFTARSIPYLIAYNKADLAGVRKPLRENELYVSARTGENVEALKEKLGRLPKTDAESKTVLSGVVSPHDVVVLVVPVDAAAPKGRLILPQQQVLRELLDLHAAAVVCQPEELTELLAAQKTPPKLVITDSQAFEKVAAEVPEEILLTSFSILFARYKGDLPRLIEGARALEALRDGDKILISEGCTHHRQCGDIGTVKLPRLIEKYTGKKPCYAFTSGGDFPDALSEYALIVHCGGCMLNEREMRRRIEAASAAGVPMLNYGAAFASMIGDRLLERSLRPFPEIRQP